MKLTFWGAAGAVTGSMHHLEIQDAQYLLDCGLYQGHRKEAEQRNKNFPFSCADIRSVLLSHAHIDHSGNLPQLVKKGFHGPIYTSPATADLCGPMLADSAHLQEKDADYINMCFDWAMSARDEDLDPHAPEIFTPHGVRKAPATHLPP